MVLVSLLLLVSLRPTLNLHEVLLRRCASSSLLLQFGSQPALLPVTMQWSPKASEPKDQPREAPEAARAATPDQRDMRVTMGMFQSTVEQMQLDLASNIMAAFSKNVTELGTSMEKKHNELAKAVEANTGKTERLEDQHADTLNLLDPDQRSDKAKGRRRVTDGTMH